MEWPVSFGIGRIGGLRTRRSDETLLLVALASALQGCSSSEQLLGIGPGDSLDAARTKDFSGLFSDDEHGRLEPRQTSRASVLFPGAPDASPKRSPGDEALAAPGVTSRSGDIEINFDQADIQVVAKALLGEALGLDFTIDPRVHGTITVVSAGPIPRKDVLPTFENRDRMSNAAVVHEGRLVRIVPLPEANGANAPTIGSVQAGYGVTIIPLRYTSAAMLAKVADNYLVRPGAIRVDTARNLILAQGTSSERRAVVEMISGFDVEWLRNRSVGIYPLKSASPDSIIRELDRIFDSGENGSAPERSHFKLCPG